ncbi:MAG: 50S ribosomal protein L10 [candidate division Zixibacteria bacterium RBG_16_53_22]|nr:MAG: 50S ribosomal protein L10 [candidate division Zixibacteria bacterium RBG_16_53_22]
MDRTQKEKELAGLKEKMANARQIIITDHTGINVADMTILRRKLRNARSEMRISKNTLLRLAVKDTGMSSLAEHFNGPTSIIFGYDDPSVPAKIIYDSIKDNEKPRFKAIFYDGRMYGADSLKTFAELPPREVVLATLIGTVQAPISQFIMVLEAATREFVGTLDAVAKSKE